MYNIILNGAAIATAELNSSASSTLPVPVDAEAWPLKMEDGSSDHLELLEH
ncbi:hypothetical protein POX_d06056 [Penicillium oxalicum]|uniref:Uncharacterized protein n=1 Tax=Penicillium oxalicum (strain 114-2 / CGMCC 5302) TaxID=933388 RepID=S7ZSR4_PENO1|nr:hypothetical protein POX_d06056 [Penicillium oxalicum]EPS31751.1 hypothetical protein PDE_06708 [Penicillium oxalicum 114-2]KAI2790539.1 hypothetical protein POX_d06056 [Penicillium oxalicum]